MIVVRFLLSFKSTQGKKKNLGNKVTWNVELVFMRINVTLDEGF